MNEFYNIMTEIATKTKDYDLQIKTKMKSINAIVLLNMMECN